jgi:sporulation protein YlmC with PRC-barrel domain
MTPRRSLVLAAALLASTGFAELPADAPVPASPAPGGKAPSPVTAGIPIGLTTAQTEIMASGIRATTLVGAEVYNDRNESLGTIEDLVIATDGSLSVAIVEVSSALGARRRVAIPVQQFHQMKPRPVLPRVDREALRKLPDFSWPTPAAEK